MSDPNDMDTFLARMAGTLAAQERAREAAAGKFAALVDPQQLRGNMQEQVQTHVREVELADGGFENGLGGGGNGRGGRGRA